MDTADHAYEQIPFGGKVIAFGVIRITDMLSQINEVALKMFPRDDRVYTYLDTAIYSNDPDVDNSRYPFEFDNFLICSKNLLDILKLKVDMSLMITREIDPKAGVCNGTKGVCFPSHMVHISIKRLDQ
ncbi:hypothetical protein J3Q64DRAFT_1698273 [Phycomyces blakesleeanus]|uniref:DNA helicase Pif1-like 2B domain-containing protein n=2 Tax=Phycomyces blakesleeanus TaxID=4837 RepID=A0A162XJT8_PHYB8|nr:hypothetical protein PHYBLDRAFT_64279 [Phycomyces blakesleeanus NRRL 1555(-)]OAD75355.1 hypothetical protein PHYBLDRAFT_64279 [Phycomyces blakesleeanus NRRL 1555(-)]|eukprot:XP_018293395.1 hypothetical protein PHYBLDRAFT_64279 [Phycomyces blakesleeanus NRRL 1555(-)]